MEYLAKELEATIIDIGTNLKKSLYQEKIINTTS